MTKFTGNYCAILTQRAPKAGIFCAIVDIINNHRSNHLTTGGTQSEILLPSTHSLSE
ncbi:hypothetical protein AB32_2145 [Escherichia coli 2-316-03_S1_C2]|nr:predicted protein [Escherichia coli FVEC1412]EFF13017.1 conserved hypothetical protein [Escherichia coli B354]EFI19846.1 predicted protein [Escherichia coli FVEC1302]EFJ73248.1 hypothetical protein HMPREF9552_03110 [Escherichia coli MS 198-1]EGI40879.1 conserved hypothetical protein [Escherichia coli TA280]EGI50668.1 conserved hypothetical protein [Escherichia coli H299]ESA72274.1 hypothetical protein HMPREF1588_02776 [Escherichia coli 110957]ESA79714.1 hypothetical protein HMPREF1599_052